MKKQVVVLLVSALFATAAYADNFTGPAVELGLGVTKLSGDKDDGVSSKAKADAAIRVSYGFAFAGDFIGMPLLEIRPFSRKVATDTEDGNDWSQKNKHTYGIAYIQGYRIADSFLPYVKLGYQWAKLKENDAGYHDSYKPKGLNYGLGMKYAITPNIEVGGEYVHARLKFTDDGEKSKYKENSFFLTGAYRF